MLSFVEVSPAPPLRFTLAMVGYAGPLWPKASAKLKVVGLPARTSRVSSSVVSLGFDKGM